MGAPAAPAPAPETFVGIDVSKASLDVAIDDGPAFTVANTPEGHAELAARLAPLRPRRIVLEATGRPVDVVNPE